MKLPEIESYGESKSSNAMVVNIGKLDVYFSYCTPVAFRTPKTGLIVRQNDWSTTTGRHLNLIDGGQKDIAAGKSKRRVTEAEFNRIWTEFVEELFYNIPEFKLPKYEIVNHKKVILEPQE